MRRNFAIIKNRKVTNAAGGVVDVVVYLWIEWKRLNIATAAANSGFVSAVWVRCCTQIVVRMAGCLINR